jgi:hypothetical protein
MTNSENMEWPKKGFWKKVLYLVKYHFHALLFTYIWFGLVVCGLAAPEHRVRELGSGLITQGWHLSALSCLLVLPWPVVYVIIFLKKSKKRENH